MPLSHRRLRRLQGRVVSEWQKGTAPFCHTLSANKVRDIRCVTCSEPYSARLSREHNNTNCVAFGARVVGIETAKDIVDAWLGAEYEGGRHQVRIDMLAEIEKTPALAAAE